ncbi:hypothetical protein [Streptomyces sp. NPDC007346]|uniref:hypothetical protein n=1 Tax=Streptomyces sp. NPDC007346 TaxID=3154682 RepID=UPI0034523B9F
MARLDDRYPAEFAAHAAPGAIRAKLTAERAERRRADQRIDWLEDLLVQRTREIAAGTWPGTPTTTTTDTGR